jgi:hypothetical protein
MGSYQGSSGWNQGNVPTTPAINSAKWGDVSAVTISTIATVLTPSTGKKFRLLGGYISMSANASVLFEDNAALSTAKFRTPLLLANTPFYFDLGKGMLSAAANNVLKATSSAAGAITGTLFYSEE